MPPIGQEKIAADQLIEVTQQIAVERGGDPEGIVVSRFEHRDRFAQVDADQQHTTLRRVAELAQEVERLRWREVTDTRTRIEKQALSVTDLRWQKQPLRKVGADAEHRQLRVLQLQAG